MEVQGRWQATDNQATADVQLKIFLSGAAPAGVAPEQRRDAPLGFQKNVRLSEGKPAIIRLEDQPLAVDGDEKTVRQHVAIVIAKRVEAGGGASQAADPAAVTTSDRASLQMEVYTVSAEPEKLASLDLSQLTADSPSGGKILQILGQYGDAHQSCGLVNTFSLGGDFKAISSQQVPIVQSMRMGPDRKPISSASYKEVGTIVEMKPSRWNQVSTGWTSDVELSAEASGVTDSGVEVDPDIAMPAFTQLHIQQRRQFQSGRPEYFVAQNLTASPGAKARVSVSVIRMVMTHPEK